MFPEIPIFSVFSMSFLIPLKESKLPRQLGMILTIMCTNHAWSYFSGSHPRNSYVADHPKFRAVSLGILISSLGSEGTRELGVNSYELLPYSLTPYLPHSLVRR